MKEIGKTAIWALEISVPVSLMGAYLSMGLAHSTGFILFITKILYAPFFMFTESLEITGMENIGDIPHAILALLSMFVGYFVVIYLIRSLFRYAKYRNT
jgi:hypothetical protein